MGFDNFGHAATLAFQVFFLDLILSGDNALVIALACRGLPRPLVKRAVAIGTGFAILLRVLLTTVVSFLLQLPLLRLIGALLLLVIAVKLLLGDLEPDEAAMAERSDADRLWSAVIMVVSADLVLSLDNVVALAAAAQGSVLFLILGLALSVPLLMYGSLFITRLLDDNPLLTPAASAMIAWIAGRIAVDDPLIAPWIASQAPALTLGIPLLCVVFVLVESRIIRERRPQLSAPPPLALGRRLAARLARFGASAEELEATALMVPVALPATEPLATDTAAVLPAVPTPHPEPALPLPPAAAPAPAKPQAKAAAPADPVQSSRALTLLLRLLVALAALLGIAAIGWLLFHLASQGVLPTPEHPQG
ncbi:YjbE family putative metal transport protein [Neisseriaceae bacterium JH1-16]|nr:YjbE family putative metal transport protein [Neisseriaceae bacterium JH1-16]